MVLEESGKITVIGQNFKIAIKIVQAARQKIWFYQLAHIIMYNIRPWFSFLFLFFFFFRSAN